MYQIPVFLAANWEVTVLTKVDSSYKFPDHPKLDILRLPSDRTTSFKYKRPTHEDREDRVLEVKSIGAAFQLSELEMELQFDAVVVSGIAEELTLNQVLQIPKQITAKAYYLDLQTLTRKINEDGLVRISPLDLDTLQELGKNYRVIKGSDIEFADNIEDIVPIDSLLIRTFGSEKIKIFGQKVDEFTLEIVPDDQIVDATGSGDIFLAGIVLTDQFDHPLSKMIKTAHKLAMSFLTIPAIPSIEQTRDIIDDLKNFGISW